MFMNNMKEATTDAMKETAGKVVNEKEKAATENIETIKKRWRILMVLTLNCYVF